MICDHHHLTPCQPVWRLSAAAVSGAGQAEHRKHSLASHTLEKQKAVFKSVPCNGFFPKIGQSRFLLSRVLHGVGRAWGLSACESSVRFTGPLESTTPD